MTRSPVPRPAHLPERLTITLWDFSWYVRSGPGEPFEDIDRAFAHAVERGYNSVRIGAMPALVVRKRPGHVVARLGPLGVGSSSVVATGALIAAVSTTIVFFAFQRHFVSGFPVGINK